jgi:hypothetical protein
MKTAVSFAIVMFLASPFLADRRHVVTDDKTEFSAIRTFSISEGRAKTTRPELNNRLIFKKIEDAIRAQLSARGLTESQNRPDVVVSFVVGEDRPHGPSVVFDQGTLVIELTRRDSNSMIWQGVYTDEESTPAKVAEKLPRNVQKLLSEFPPKKKK